MFSTGTVNANSNAMCAIVTTAGYESVTLDFKTWKYACNSINPSNVQQQQTVCLVFSLQFCINFCIKIPAFVLSFEAEAVVS